MARFKSSGIINVTETVYDAIRSLRKDGIEEATSLDIAWRIEVLDGSIYVEDYGEYQSENPWREITRQQMQRAVRQFCGKQQDGYYSLY